MVMIWCILRGGFPFRGARKATVGLSRGRIMSRGPTSGYGGPHQQLASGQGSVLKEVMRACIR